MTFKNNKKSRYFLGGKGSQFYKNLGKTILERKDSPNPIGQKNISRLKVEFLKVALVHSKLSDVPKAITIYGIGGLHNESILRRLQDLNESDLDTYGVDELRQMTVDTADLNDGQIGGSYSANQVTNQILVEAIMEYLEVSKVHVRQLDLTQGALVFGLGKFKD